MIASDYIKQLEENISRISAERDKAFAERDDALKRALEIEKENLELKKKLGYYENSNSPPSARKFPKKIKDKNKSKKKRGAPKGHRGATRPKPEPDEIVDVVATECEICGSHNVQDLNDPDKRTIEDIPPPQKIKVIQFNLHRVRCGDCDHEFISKHPDCPQVGNFGIYLLIYATMLKFHLRGVLRKIQDFLLFENNFEISPKGILDILLRVGDVCKMEYDKSILKIRNAEWIHIDETGIKINGDPHWLWIFRTNDDEILVVIRKSRGRKVLNEILGESWDRPIVVDGWKAYWKYSIIQRCWAHLLRKVDAFKDKSNYGKQLSEEIHQCFNRMKDFPERDLSMDERIKQKSSFEKEMKETVEKYREYEELTEPVVYIKNGLGKWYTCLLYPGMEPTNNLGEQAIREHVIMRKIIGCFRSEKGAKNYQYIASLLASWKLQDKNIFKELEEILRKELCLS